MIGTLQRIDDLWREFMRDEPESEATPAIIAMKKRAFYFGAMSMYNLWDHVAFELRTVEGVEFIVDQQSAILDHLLSEQRTVPRAVERKPEVLYLERP